MDNTMRLSSFGAVIDSLNLVKQVLGRGLANNKHRAVIVIYSRAGGPYPYQLALGAGYHLKESLKKQGIDTDNICIDSFTFLYKNTTPEEYTNFDFVFEDNSKPQKFYRKNPYRP
ncbi:MAG: hypothetical protein ACRYFX_05560 [Janthinobacterium lividum]